MKEIPLTKGQVTLVDDEDYERVSKLKWYYGTGGYAERRQCITVGRKNRKYKSMIMHRVIMDAPEDMQVDHINRNKLDNRKENLRLCTDQQNKFNVQPKGQTSKYKGVSWDKQRRKFTVLIYANDKRIYIGHFCLEVDAAKAYNEMAAKYFGEFAYLNKMMESDYMKWIKKEPRIQYQDSDSIVAKLAKINGIKDVNTFMRPDISYCHDPYLMSNIQEAANEILIAISQHKRVAVSFDVDADGITSGAMMYRYIKQFSNNVYYIFSERSGGHGIEMQLDKIEDGTDLVIICDSSTNSTEACKQLVDRGIKVVILDHHPIEQDNPYAIIVNPQLEGDNYPNKDLSGAGVVYKTLLVVDDSVASNTAEKYLDLVATGMCSDVMSMAVLENRYLVRKGLKDMINPGLLALLKGKVELKDVNSQTVGFTLGPMLNGAARMDKIELAIKLLIEDDIAVCSKLAKEIKKLNNSRKALEMEHFSRVKPQIDENDKVIIVVDSNIDKGFNGLIANKIANAYKRPAIILNEENDKLSGSYRSYGDFDMKGFLNQFFVSTFVRGHSGAGGYSVKAKNLEQLKKLCNKKLDNVSFDTTVEYHLELNINEISTDVIRQVEAFNLITGKDNPLSKFLIRDLFVTEVAILGDNKDTVKIVCGDLTLMRFRMSNAQEFADSIHPFSSVNVVGSLNVNEYFNFAKRQLIITNQLIIDDIKEA